MKKIFSATARARATVANQPAFDRGCFPVKVLAVLHGSPPALGSSGATSITAPKAFLDEAYGPSWDTPEITPVTHL